MSEASRGIWARNDALEKLKALAGQRLTASQIAAALCAEGIQVTRNAVIGKCERDGIPLGRRPGAQRTPKPARIKKFTASAAGPKRPPVADARRGKGAFSLPAPPSSPRPSVPAPTAHGGSRTNDGLRKPPTSPERLATAFASARPGIPFAVATGGQCKWPVGGEGLSLKVCGAPALNGRPYCPHHHRMAYVPAGRPPLPPLDFSTARAPKPARDGDLVDAIGEAA